MNIKHAYIILATAVFLTSCSQDSIICDNEASTVEEESGVTATMQELMDSSDSTAVTRSSLVYDNTQSPKTMMFAWDEDDNIGVFTTTSRPTQHKFTLTIANSSNALKASFKSSDMGTTALSEGNYVAYMPYASSVTSYTAIPVTYLGQTASAFPMMGKFYAATVQKETDSNYKAYVASEKAASAHLSAYDYASSLVATADSKGNCTFEMKRAGATTRFFLKSPNSIKYDKLILVVNGGPEILATGTMNATNAPATLTAKTTTKNMALEFNPVLDMTKDNSGYYDTYKGVTTGYIVTYMMLPPVDLSKATNIYVYLKGQDDANNEYYYKSGALNKPTLTANMFHQWTSANNSTLEPIEFSEITVQQWKEGTAVDNGDEGTGTIGW